MKKALLIVVIIVLLAGIGSVVYFFVSGLGVSHENILPSGPLVINRWTNIEEDIAQFAQTPLWQSIKEIDWVTVLEKNMVSKQQQEQIIEAFENISAQDTQNFISKFFGQDVVLAIYPIELKFLKMSDIRKDLGPSVLLESLENVFIATRLSPKAKLIELYARQVGNMGEFLKKDVVKYGDFDIHVLSTPLVDLRLCLMRIKDFLIIGLNEDKIKWIADTYLEGEKILANDPAYIVAKANFQEGSSVQNFINFEKSVDNLTNQILKIIDECQSLKIFAPDPDAFQQQLDLIEKQVGILSQKMRGLKVISHSIIYGQDMKSLFSIHFNREQMESELARMYSCQPAENKNISFASQEAIFYQSNNCFDADLIWKQLKEKQLTQANQGGQVNFENTLKEMEQTFGYSLEKDVIPNFGDQIGWYMSGIELTKFLGRDIPIPQFIFFVNIKDQSVFLKQLEAIKTSPLFVSQDEKQGGVALTSISTQLSNEIKPTFCLLDNFLLIGNHPDQIKTAIDTYQQLKPGLSADPDFQSVDFNLAKQNVYVQYVQLGSSLDEIKKILEWVNQKLKDDEVEQQAFKSGKQKRLEDIQDNIKKLENTLADKQKQIKEIEGLIWTKQEKGEDAQFEQVRYNRLDKEIENLELQLKDDRLREQESIVDLEQFSLAGMPADVNRYYLENVIYPLMEGMKFIKAFSIKSTIKKDVMDIWLYIHTQ